MALQGELWRTEYGVATCVRCGSLGTIVDMGLCCRIAALARMDSVSEEGRWHRLSTDRLERTNEVKPPRRRAA